jgi:hypothetical protein
VNFSMLFGRIKKNQKVQTPKQKRERESDKRHRLTNVSKTPSSSINSVVLPINNNTLYKR